MPAVIHTWLALGLSLFQRQQFFFSPDAAGIPGEASVCPNHTMAGNDNSRPHCPLPGRTDAEGLFLQPAVLRWLRKWWFRRREWIRESPIPPSERRFPENEEEPGSQAPALRNKHPASGGPFEIRRTLFLLFLYQVPGQNISGLQTTGR